MSAKSRKSAKVGVKEKCRAIAEVFGVPVDPEDTDYVRFLYDRRDLATVAERSHRELAYVIEIDDLEKRNQGNARPDS
jgi:hypothetical protein